MKYEDEINLMLPLNDEQNTDFFTLVSLQSFNTQIILILA